MSLLLAFTINHEGPLQNRLVTLFAHLAQTMGWLVVARLM